MANLQTSFFEYFNALARYMRTQPLNLGGYHSYSGGIGGPPGGFIGWLPQTRVAYDVSEIASSGLPSSTSYSGASLVDNLNHIRYRLNSLEDEAFGISVEEDDVEIASGITVVNFQETFDITYSAPNQANVKLNLTTADKYVPSGIFGEDLTNQIGSSATHFTVGNQIYDSSLRVYHNGIRQRASNLSYDVDHLGFTTAFTVTSGDTLSVDYDMLVNDSTRIVTSGVTLGYLQTYYYDKTDVNGIAAAKADLAHTHTESQITDLVHDADYIKGVAVTTSGPSVGQALVYNGSAYTPTNVSTSIKQINQQFIFTVEGNIDDAGTGVKPLRIYSHDTNGYATIDEIFLCVDTPPSGSGVRVDIMKNGISIFDPPEYAEILDGSDTGIRYTSFADDQFNYNDYFQMELVQTNAVASDLTVHIRFHWLTS